MFFPGNVIVFVSTIILPDFGDIIVGVPFLHPFDPGFQVLGGDKAVPIPVDSIDNLPQPLLALLRGELVEGLGVLLAQEGLVVVLEALVVLGRPLTQLLAPRTVGLARSAGGASSSPRTSPRWHPRQPGGIVGRGELPAGRHRASDESGGSAREWGLGASAAAGLGSSS